MNSTINVSCDIGKTLNGTMCTNVTDSNPDASRVVLKNYLRLWVELVAFLAIDVAGVVGNGFVIAVVLSNAGMRTSANYFVLSLSVADMLVSVFVTPMVISSRYRRAWLLGDGACVMQAFINFTCLLASLFSLATIAVNRVIVTRIPGKYPVLFSASQTYLYITITWFFAILYAAFPIMGWGRYTFDYKRWNCIYSRRAAPAYSFFFASCCVFLPLTICAVSYIIIWITFAQSKKNLLQFPGSAVSGNISSSERKLTKNLFVVWLAFFVCWLPMNVLLFVDPKGLLDERIYTLAVWFLLCNSCVNPIIYGVQNKHYRRAYLKLIEQIRHCKKTKHRIQPLSTTVTTVSAVGRYTAGSTRLTSTGPPDTNSFNLGPPQMQTLTLPDPVRKAQRQPAALRKSDA